MLEISSNDKSSPVELVSRSCRSSFPRWHHGTQIRMVRPWAQSPAPPCKSWWRRRPAGGSGGSSGLLGLEPSVASRVSTSEILAILEGLEGRPCFLLWRRHPGRARPWLAWAHVRDGGSEVRWSDDIRRWQWTWSSTSRRCFTTQSPLSVSVRWLPRNILFGWSGPTMWQFLLRRAISNTMHQHVNDTSTSQKDLVVRCRKSWWENICQRSITAVATPVTTIVTTTIKYKKCKKAHILHLASTKEMESNIGRAY